MSLIHRYPHWVSLTLFLLHKCFFQNSIGLLCLAKSILMCSLAWACMCCFYIFLFLGKVFSPCVLLTFFSMLHSLSNHGFLGKVFTLGYCLSSFFACVLLFNPPQLFNISWKAYARYLVCQYLFLDSSVTTLYILIEIQTRLFVPVHRLHQGV
jgi:hypothetical protein